MRCLHFDSLPPKTTKGTLIRLLEQVGDLDRGKIGRIEIRGRTATVEVPADMSSRLVKKLDGTSLAQKSIRVWEDSARANYGEDDHFDRLLNLIELEAQAEAEASIRLLQRMSPAEAEGTGRSIVGLVLVDEEAGLGGRSLATFRKREQGKALPWTRLGVGSPVLLSAQDSKSNGWRGVVSQRREYEIQVAFTELSEEVYDAGYLRLDISHDETARLRQKNALQRFRSARGDRQAQLREILIGEEGPGFRPREQEVESELLNPSQQAAVTFALGAEALAIIHGPPGTGKTTTVVELIRQAVAEGDKILACAPSNLAVDNILERLIQRDVEALRIGHPARVSPALREHTLDLLVENDPDVKLARKLLREASNLQDRAARWTRAKPQPGAKREMREEARQLREDARRIERQVVQQLLDRADVVCATLTGLDSEVLGQRDFEWAVIDEACQSTEPACWIPIQRANRLILAGDHCQLPPTVISQQAARQGFDVSLLERLMDQHGAQLSRQLTTQYRMHEAIMRFSSGEFYEDNLTADPSVAAHLLADLDGVNLECGPLEFIDTAGGGIDEELEPDGESRRNPGEAELVKNRVEQLLAAGVQPGQIAIISPYAAQVRLLRESLPGIEIDTVDGFQGRENEVVVISLVRSNAESEIGFLGDVRRMNVALTRAKRKLIVIGDSATIAGHAFYARLLEYFESEGAYRTIWEL